ncbi:hypothetical protein ACFVZT_42295, partial [Streptomyces sp. NPDC058321]|uniref:hypothetical protein n=1 Tax=Streptomyces sp. NPDC058321 TaxID=3346445 RepID=UPI0036E64004
CVAPAAGGRGFAGRRAAAYEESTLIERNEQSGPAKLVEEPGDLAYRALLGHAMTCGRCAAS